MDEVFGQSRAIDLLQAALQSGRLHHAWIFHGLPGVGKFTTALAFARVLLCHKPQHDLSGRVVACGSCESCRLLKGVTAGSDTAARPHPDFHVVTKELARFNDERAIRERKLTTIPFEVLRTALLEPVYRSAQLRHNKVVVVDEAELIDPRGQNILLKTLEEPPPDTYLILVTSSEDKLLPTIRSRCQRVAFLPLSEEIVSRWVADHLKEWSAAQRRWLVGFAGGSLGRADLAVRYNLASWAEGVLPALDQMARGKFPAGLGTIIAKSIDEFAKQWVDGHENASKEAANRLAGSLMWTMISQHARGRIAELSGGASVGASGGDATAAEGLLNPWLGVIDALGAAEVEIAANVNAAVAMDHLVSRMFRAMSGEVVEREALPA